ncbi:uncharacterized protein LOC143179756 [Calliopsis andreniformis]|uniref:uncharacterized protein LOC143179756 n=1 Tax=Calliopsis andreniformis TaxID=337506 RepID=UPI003FCDC268
MHRFTFLHYYARKTNRFKTEEASVSCGLDTKYVLHLISYRLRRYPCAKMSRPRIVSSYFYERKCYICERRAACPEPDYPRKTTKIVRFIEPSRMLRSASPHYPSRGSDARVIRLTADQEAVLQEQFNRWPRAPHTADIVLLAAETGLSESDVEAWYAIRLAQWRKEQGLGGNLGLH